MPRSFIRLLLAGLVLALVGCGGRTPVAHAPTDVRRHAPAAPARVAERCTTVWVGRRRAGLWASGRNWSKGREPGRDDQACLDRGTSVVIAGGAHEVGSIIGGGELRLTGGLLAVTDPAWRAELAGLRVSHARVVSQTTVEITRRFRIGAGADLAGPGLFYLGAAATTTVGAEVDPATARGLAAQLSAPIDTGRSRPGPAGAAAASACGPHSPPGVEACSSDDTPVSREVRATWRRFADLVNAATTGHSDMRRDQDKAAGLLAPEACVRRAASPPSPVTAALACRVAIYNITASAARRFLDGELSPLIVIANRAYADVDGVGNVRFVRRRGAWRITWLFHD